jgi:hypothetical protein
LIGLNELDIKLVREVRELQRVLNQKVGLKFSRTVNFASRFIIIIESINFKF